MIEQAAMWKLMIEQAAMWNGWSFEESLIQHLLLKQKGSTGVEI